MFDDKDLLQLFSQLTMLVEADTGKAKGNNVLTQVGSAAKTSSSTTTTTPAKSSSSSKKEDVDAQKPEQTGSKILDNLKSKSGDDSKKPPEVKRATQKIRRNKEITNSIKSLQKPKDIATFLGDVLQNSIEDGAKESDVKNAVAIFSRETLKKK